MGSTYAPKATFKVTKTTKQGRVFTPVNKRAKIVAKRLSKRTKITVQELRSSVGKGSYKFYQYNADGTLSPIRF